MNDKDKQPVQPPSSSKLAALSLVPSKNQVRSFLRDEPELWAQRDERNRWFCPYCGKIVSEVALPPGNGFLLLQDCPQQMREHLLNCGAVLSGLPPAKYHGIDASKSGEFRSAINNARLSQRHTLRPVPKIDGFEMACLYRPMEAIGGDFYDYIPLPGGRTGIVIGDPSGHGVEACMLMAVTKKLVSLYARTGLSPAECLNVVNTELYDDVMAGAFISAFYAILDPAERKLSYARAGQNPPLLYNPERIPQVQVLETPGIALAIDSGSTFHKVIREDSLELLEGDLIVFYTDGLVELTDENGEEFGAEGLAELLKKNYDRPIGELINQMWYTAENLFKSTGQPDDITIMLLRVK